MDFESELTWHIAALGRLAREAHETAVAAGENRRVYVLDTTTEAVIDIFATYGLRLPAAVIADAIELYVKTKAAEGNSRARMCLAYYGVKQGPTESS